MTATLVAIIITGVAGIASAIVTFTLARRANRGSVEPSDARTVFDGLTKLVDKSIERVDTLQRDLDEAREEIARLEAEINRLRARAIEVETLRRQLAEADERLDALHKDYDALRRLLDHMQKNSRGDE